MSQTHHVTGQLFNPSPLRGLPPSAELALSRQIYQAVRASGDGIISITPALAQRILDLLNFSRQRAIKPTNVMTLKNTILSGQWQSAHPITFARRDELLIGVNLQHRMHAIVETDHTLPVRIIVVECADAAAVATLYRQFDGKTGMRNDADAMAACDLGGDSGLRASTLGRAMSAMSVLLNDMAPLQGTPTMQKVFISMIETRMEAFPLWLDQVRQWEGVVQAAPPHVRRKLQTAGVMAACLYTLKHQPEAALAFWRGLAENNLLAKDDPRARLLVDFQSRKGAQARELIQAVSYAWNAWYAKRKLGGIRCEAIHPIHFAGTPLAKFKH